MRGSSGFRGSQADEAVTFKIVDVLPLIGGSAAGKRDVRLQRERLSVFPDGVSVAGFQTNAVFLILFVAGVLFRRYAADGAVRMS